MLKSFRAFFRILIIIFVYFVALFLRKINTKLTKYESERNVNSQVNKRLKKKTDIEEAQFEEV